MVLLKTAIRCLLRKNNLYHKKWIITGTLIVKLKYELAEHEVFQMICEKDYDLDKPANDIGGSIKLVIYK